jgi:hypothetical protein
MMWYLFSAVGFPLGGIGQETCTKIGKRQLCTKGETVHKTLQKHIIHKIENKCTKQENRHTKNIKNVSQIIWK